MGASCSAAPGKLGCKFPDVHSGYENARGLAETTYFSVSEVEALYEVFKKVCPTIGVDDLIHKDAFRAALFVSGPMPDGKKRTLKRNLLAERIFDAFDVRKEGGIGFPEFVRCLSVFHPDAPLEDKIAFSFGLHDPKKQGYIDRAQGCISVKEMLVAALGEAGMNFSDEVLESILDSTFAEVKPKKPGKIDKEEWAALVTKNPAVIKNMTLPQLRKITTTFPDFIFYTQIEEADTRPTRKQ